MDYRGVGEGLPTAKIKTKTIAASHEPEGSLTEVSLNPSQFLGALDKAKQMSRTSKMNQAMVDAGKTNGDPNLTKADNTSNSGR